MDFLAQARRQMLAGQMKDSREQLLISLQDLTDDEMTQPGVCGDWSVTEVLAHVAAWDRATTAAFRQMLEGERPAFIDLDEDGVEGFNAEQHAKHAGISPEDALTELTAAREELLEVLRETGNAEMFAPAPGDESADLSIAACLDVQISHDQEHALMIEEWRESRSAG
jgi:uncharacterized protein (TIGR03083 family)